MKKICPIFLLILFLQSCSWVTDFYIINKSNSNIVITYFSKHLKKEINCNIEQPRVCREGELSTGKCRTLKPDEYRYDKEKCTIELTLAPGNAARIDRACCSYTGPEDSPGLSRLGSLMIKTSSGSITYEGMELLKAFNEVDKTLYVLYYR